VEEIRIVPGTELFVYERGSRREREKDLGRRVLVIGIGLLAGFSQNAFRAVLAHEYGHFSHRDTAGGDIALRVNQDMMKFAIAMAYAGQAVWWNIAFQFLRVYDFLFRRISFGATRLQEVLADRAAVRLYGAMPFEEGLRHVIRRSIEFNRLADTEINEAVQAGRALQNMYALEPHQEKAVGEEIESALNRATSEDDTHPSPLDRFRLVSRVGSVNQWDRSGSVWELFANREAITQQMNSEIERMVHSAAA
jgi:Zn-dependent protease with chaperone function